MIPGDVEPNGRTGLNVVDYKLAQALSTSSRVFPSSGLSLVSCLLSFVFVGAGIPADPCACAKRPLFAAMDRYRCGTGAAGYRNQPGMIRFNRYFASRCDLHHLAMRLDRCAEISRLQILGVLNDFDSNIS